MKLSIVTCSLWACTILGVALDANADDAVRFGPNDVASVFHISKSENRNEVHYGIRLDEHCAPAQGAVFAYWRELEKGPNETSQLLAVEQPAYGIARQQMTHGKVRLTLRALPSRTVIIEPKKGEDGRCTAVAHMEIAGAPARLDRVFAQIAWPAGVDWLQLEGAAEPDGHPVRERVQP